MPIRVQLRRTKGWRKPANTVVVSRPSIFGNISTCTRPHHCALRPCECCPDDNDGWCCVLAFEEYVRSGLENRPARTGLLRYAFDAMNGYPRRTKLIARLPSLRGKNLACWCALDEPCHADVLLRIANDAVNEGTEKTLRNQQDADSSTGNAAHMEPK